MVDSADDEKSTDESGDRPKLSDMMKGLAMGGLAPIQGWPPIHSVLRLCMAGSRPAMENYIWVTDAALRPSSRFAIP